MQDPLTSSFRCGETFDTAPYKGLHVSTLWRERADTQVRPYKGLLVSLWYDSVLPWKKLTRKKYNYVYNETEKRH